MQQGMAGSWTFFFGKMNYCTKCAGLPKRKKQQPAMPLPLQTTRLTLIGLPSFLPALIAWKMSNAPREGSVDRKF